MTSAATSRTSSPRPCDPGGAAHQPGRRRPYAQPDWLIDRERLRDRFPPRVRATELWRVDPQYLEQAQDDATLLAIRDQERAGLDIITDGEMRRESYSNRFATALEGVDIDNPGTALDRSGHPNPVPRVVGPIERMHPVAGARRRSSCGDNTSRPVKITVPGPFTMSQQAQNDFYDDEARAGARLRRRRPRRDRRPVRGRRRHRPDRRAVHAGAAGEGARVRRRGAATARSTGSRARPPCTSASATPRSSTSARPPTHSCPSSTPSPCDQISIETAQSGIDTAVIAELPGKRIILGVIDLDDMAVESPETVAERIRRALPLQDCARSWSRRRTAA